MSQRQSINPFLFDFQCFTCQWRTDNKRYALDTINSFKNNIEQYIKTIKVKESNRTNLSLRNRLEWLNMRFRELTDKSYALDTINSFKNNIEQRIKIIKVKESNRTNLVWNGLLHGCSQTSWHVIVNWPTRGRYAFYTISSFKTNIGQCINTIKVKESNRTNLSLWNVLEWSFINLKSASSVNWPTGDTPFKRQIPFKNLFRSTSEQ